MCWEEAKNAPAFSTFVLLVSAAEVPPLHFGATTEPDGTGPVLVTMAAAWMADGWLVASLNKTESLPRVLVLRKLVDPVFGDIPW